MIIIITYNTYITYDIIANQNKFLQKAFSLLTQYHVIGHFTDI